MKYSVPAYVLTIGLLFSPTTVAAGGLHGNGVSGSMGAAFGDRAVNGKNPDPAVEFNGDVEYFVEPETYLLFRFNHTYQDFTFASDDELTLNLTQLIVGVGKETPVTPTTAFYLEGLLGLGYGELEVETGANTVSADVDASQLGFGLGFRGLVDRDEWSFGAEAGRVVTNAGSGASRSRETSIGVTLKASALFRLNEQLLLGPYARYTDEDSGVVGLRLRLTNW